MAGFRVSRFGGEIRSVEPRNLPDQNAQVALNCDFRHGDLRPIRGAGSAVHSTTAGAEHKSLYGHERDDGSIVWFTWSSQGVTAISNPIARDDLNRAYIADGGYLKVTTTSMATGGGEPYPSLTYRVGVPVPVGGGASGNTTGCDPDEEIAFAMYYTFVNAWGEEGPPSSPFYARVCPDSGVTLTLNAPDGTFNNFGTGSVKRIYIATDGPYEYVGDVSVSTSSYTIDPFEPDQFSGQLPAENWYPPPEHIAGVAALPNGISVGFHGKDLYFSEPFMPWAWPPSYYLTVGANIVGLGVAGNSLIVTTTGAPHLVSGADPAAMSMTELDVNEPCVSADSVVSMGGYVMYVSENGLVQVDSGGRGKVISQKYYAPAQWRSLVDATSVVAANHAGRYVGFHANGGFVYDPAIEGMVRLDDTSVTAAHSLLSSGDMYVARLSGSAKTIEPWDDDGAAYQSLTWRSKKFHFERPAALGWAQVYADFTIGTVSVRLFADGVEVSSQPFDVADKSPFRLPIPTDGPATAWEIEVAATTPVFEVIAVETMRELRSV